MKRFENVIKKVVSEIKVFLNNFTEKSSAQLTWDSVSKAGYWILNPVQVVSGTVNDPSKVAIYFQFKIEPSRVYALREPIKQLPHIQNCRVPDTLGFKPVLWVDIELPIPRVINGKLHESHYTPAEVYMSIHQFLLSQLEAGYFDYQSEESLDKVNK